MTEATIQSIYKQFAEFHLRLHIAEVKMTYLPKSLEKTIADGFSEHKKLFKKKLAERIQQLGKYNQDAIPKLAELKRDYVNRFNSKSRNEATSKRTNK
jgi:hypothetical protein